MSISRTLADNEGYYIPFRQPIPSIVGEYNIALKDAVLLLPKFAIPYVTGALKSLARPETYRADSDAELKFSMQQGIEIMNAIQDYPVEPSEVYIDLSYGADGSTSWKNLNDPISGLYSIQFAAWKNQLSCVDPPVVGGGVISISGTVRTHPFGALAGADLLVNVFYTPVAGKAYVVTGHSCTGLISDTGFVTGGNHQFVFDACKDFTISIDAIDLAGGFVQITSGFICGSI